MTVQQLSEKLGLTIAIGGENLNREVKTGFCCDLLSLVMGRAPADSAWMTVMGNVNSIAVAVLTDVACIILCEGTPLDEDGAKKAESNQVVVLKTERPIFEVAAALSKLL